MVRTKLVAVLLGPSGVGLVGLYQSATDLVGIVSGFGIGSSGVREVAEAYASGDSGRIACTITTLRRASWLTGWFGWVLMIACAWPLSVWTFGSSKHAGPIALLGATLLLGAVSSGQAALLQGMRRIGDLARLSILSAIAGTVVAACLYGWLGKRGIIPVLIVSAAANFTFSWWFVCRVPIVQFEMGWIEAWRASKRLIGIGLAFMWGGVLASAVAWGTRCLIFRNFGAEGNGVYQAAWSMSGLFAGFILSAMGADFYPRATAAADDNIKLNRLVNEQTEIGILLAVPGLFATLAFAPWAIRVFYTAKFLAGAELLPWFVLGIFGRVVGWPMSYIQMAKGATVWLFFSQTLSSALLMIFTFLLLRLLALPGSAIAFASLYTIQVFVTLLIAKRLSGFRWSPAARKLLIISGFLIATGFVLQQCLRPLQGLVVGLALTMAACLGSLRAIAGRLGPNHRFVQLALRVPGFRLASGL